MSKRKLKKDIFSNIQSLQDDIESLRNYARNSKKELYEHINSLYSGISELQRYCSYLNSVNAYILFSSKRAILSQKNASHEEDVCSPKHVENGTWANARAAFEVWRECQSKGEETYCAKPSGNCSVLGNEGARQFALFVEPYLAGNVLDIGCGPMPKPLYLKNYPSNRITGVDPLPDNSTHDFKYICAFAENLPFENASFDTVIMATSLDHTINPDLALSEVCRVLTPKGHFLLWEGVHYSFHGSFENYDLTSDKIVSTDGYHLFRFTILSLYNILTKFFDPVSYEMLPDSIMLVSKKKL